MRSINTMDDLIVIHPLKLFSRQKNMMLKTFEEIKNIEFPSFLKQLKDRFPARAAIDKTGLRVLSFGDDEINRILAYLYPAITNEIQRPINTNVRLELAKTKRTKTLLKFYL